MISDETFPTEFDDDIESEQKSVETTIATITETSSSNTYNSTVDWSRKPTASTSCEKSASTFYHDESTSFVSLNASKQQSIPEVRPRAPKKRISFSCQDLLANPRRNSYDHIESKVKKIIEENSSRRKVVSRHKSMIVSSSQTSIDEQFYDDADRDVLIQELRQKSKRIIELVESCDDKDKKLTALEEKCDEKDSRIYALEYDRSKMRITFDKLRVELQEMKEAKEQYKLQLALSSPPSRYLRNASSQTILDEVKVANSNPVIRELTFSTEVDNTLNLDQTHFSELNNASSDKLIPPVDIEISLDAIETLPDEIRRQQQEIVAEEDQKEVKKKKRKFRGIFKIMSCVSKQTAQ
jgi:hypothetical protein